MPDSVKFRVTCATCSTVTPFFINSNNRSEATSNPPETAIQPDSFNNKHKSAVKLFSNRMLVHHETTKFRLIISKATSRIKAGGAASSTKWNPFSPV